MLQPPSPGSANRTALRIASQSITAQAYLCVFQISTAPEADELAPPAKLRILVADDHAIVRRGLIQILVSAFGSLAVSEAATGQDVVAAVRQEPFDLLILDISMPGGSGVEILPSVKHW